ncbi:MAG: pirin family protein [Gammaproteobacteria bacterium]|nr:pirin family protein [Gammaproteobacteria bacterium]
MIEVRKSETRGHARHGWLDSRHTFSFADYHDPAHMGFGHLRVINEDRVNPGTGFPTHGHRDMEIITYVLDGALEHKDSMGNGTVIRTGDVQRMSAGTGVRHSEYNPSADAVVHFLQIWIIPRENGLVPGYEQRHFERQELDGRLRLVASADGRDGSVLIHQDVSLYAGRFDGSDGIVHVLEPGRRAFVQVVRGAIHIGGRPLDAGDGAQVAGEGQIRLDAARSAEVLVFDLA